MEHVKNCQYKSRLFIACSTSMCVVVEIVVVSVKTYCCLFARLSSFSIIIYSAETTHIYIVGARKLGLSPNHILFLPPFPFLNSFLIHNPLLFKNVVACSACYHGVSHLSALFLSLFFCSVLRECSAFK